MAKCAKIIASLNGKTIKYRWKKGPVGPNYKKNRSLTLIEFFQKLF